MQAHNWKLSPSDFAFLWEECKRCFYLKVAKGFDRPSQPFPRIFNVIDGQMKQWFEGKRAETMAPGVPAGVVQFGDGWVQSVPLSFSGHDSTCFIRGIFDTVIALDNGGYAVIDFKTTDVRSDNVAKYSRQLHAYALALEQAAPGETALSPVKSLGLLVFAPNAFAQDGSSASLQGTLSWKEIPRNDEQFRSFLGEVLSVLEQPAPPDAAPKCALCKYRDAGRRTGW